ncbi:hypothetical protein SMC26_39605 [Actinomadura fulvescens]
MDAEMEYFALLTDRTAHIGVGLTGTDYTRQDLRMLACPALARVRTAPRMEGTPTTTIGPALTTARNYARVLGLRVCRDCEVSAQHVLQRPR